MNGSFYVALVAGILAAFNPCGFAMLPAYISYFVGTDAIGADAAAARSTGDDATVSSAERRAETLSRVARAIVVGLAVTAGFMVVFGTLGLLIQGAKAQVTDYLPKATIVVGVLLIALGVAMVAGYELKLSLPRVGKAAKGASAWSMFLYGLSYAVVSLSCTISPFLAITATTFRRENVVSGLAVYLAYAAGMGTVMLLVSVLSALAQQAVVRSMRRVLPHVNRASGVLLAVVGAYLIWYGYVSEKIVTSTDTVRLGPVAWVERWSSKVSTWVDHLDRTVVISVVLFSLGAAATILWINHTNRSGTPSGPSGKESM